jgi:hypothetical protein
VITLNGEGLNDNNMMLFTDGILSDYIGRDARYHEHSEKNGALYWCHFRQYFILKGHCSQIASVDLKIISTLRNLNMLLHGHVAYDSSSSLAAATFLSEFQ